MLRKGFTLIELLVVITIIAILAGAALPYVQDYVEDARISKAKSDLGEIKNALVRWEVDNARLWNNADKTIDNLVGSYLERKLIDPWGKGYAIDGASSMVYCLGPDGDDDTGDEFSLSFRPPLAISKAYWVDANKDGKVSTGDALSIRFTRPVASTGAVGSYKVLSPTVNVSTVTLSADGKTASLQLAPGLADVTTGFHIKMDNTTPVTDYTAVKFGGPFEIIENETYIRAL